VSANELAIKSPSRRRKWILIGLAALVLLPVLVFAAWSGATLTYSYSNGERAGYMQKLSHKGWLCKTWEGELAMQNLPGTPPEIFSFSVRDDAVAKRVQELEGQKVALTYEQHKGVPSTCFGETEYFVTNVTKVGP
jgi:hypothetical protein